MEAVPRMPMLAFELKNCSEHVDFTRILKTYIEDFYGENPDTYNKECEEIDKLRQTVANIPRDFTGCSTLKKYYAQLQFLQSRFPMEEDGALAVPLTWECVFTGRPVSHSDIKYEQACVLYNIGALHSILGALDSRQSPEGMKVSCTHFQCASWAFQNLRDTFPNSLSPDFNLELLSFQSSLLLAQAQECILEKSMTDNRKNIITAKIACQIVEYYKQASRNLEAKDAASLAGGRRVKEWKKRIDLKMAYHTAVMYLYLGTESQEKQKYGECLSYLQASLDQLNEAIKLAKSEENEDIEASLTFAMDVIGGKYNSAKKDNDFVYHEKIPALESLPEVKGASLVKGIPFNPTDGEISGPDIFQRLVPMQAHEASSLYSEEKAQLLRSVVSRIEEKNGELQQYLSSLQLNPEQIFPEGPSKLPQDLLEKCAAISVKPEAIKDLINAMQSLSSVATDTEHNIQEIFRLLEEESNSEKHFQESFGKRGHNVTLDEIHKECSKYKEGLSKASQSNQDLHSAMNTHISNLKRLSGPLDELQKALPSPEQHKTPEDDVIIQEMKKLMSKVDEMKEQRQSFEAKLRKDIREDDVTSALVTREGGSQEEFFKQQLKKHDSHIELIDKNLTAQGNILKALTEANARYAKIRKIIKDCYQRREITIDALKKSFDVYEDLLGKTQKGIEFYKKLETSVKNLLERTMRVCKVQNEEREQITARLKPKVAPPSRPAAPKPGQAPSNVGTPKSTSAAMPSTAALPPGMDPALMEAIMNDPSLAAEFAPIMGNFAPPAAAAAMVSPPKSDAPKLKDFLPFMKPKTFGADAKNKAQILEASAPGDPTLFAMHGEVPGLPGSQPRLPGSHIGLPGSQPGGLHGQHPVSQPRLPGSNTGSPLPHIRQYPGVERPNESANIGELRLDGGRMPPSIDTDSGRNAPSPSMSVQQQYHPHGSQVPNTTAPARGGITQHQVDRFDLGVQSPTAPPGAPGSQNPQVQTSQPPGGPQVYNNYQQPANQPGINAGAMNTQAQQNQGQVSQQSQITNQGQVGQITQGYPSGQPVQSRPNHGYTAVQYGAMGQPVYGTAGLPGQPTQPTSTSATVPSVGQVAQQSYQDPKVVHSQYPSQSQSNPAAHVSSQQDPRMTAGHQNVLSGQQPSQPGVYNQQLQPSVSQQGPVLSTTGYVQQYGSAFGVVSTSQPQVPQPQGSTSQPQVPQPQGSTTQPHVTQPQGVISQPHVPQPQGATSQPQVPQPQGFTSQPHVPQPQGVISQHYPQSLATAVSGYTATPTYPASGQQAPQVRMSTPQHPSSQSNSIPSGGYASNAPNQSSSGAPQTSIGIRPGNTGNANVYGNFQNNNNVYQSQQPPLPGQQSLPGQQQSLLGQQQGIPSQQQTLPGQQQILPGHQQTLPGQQQTLPGQQQALAKQQQTLSGQQKQQTFPEHQIFTQQRVLPNNQATIPQQARPTLPAQQNQKLPYQQNIMAHQNQQTVYPQHQGHSQTQQPGQPQQQQLKYSQQSGYHQQHQPRNAQQQLPKQPQQQQPGYPQQQQGYSQQQLGNTQQQQPGYPKQQLQQQPGYPQQQQGYPQQPGHPQQQMPGHSPQQQVGQQQQVTSNYMATSNQNVTTTQYYSQSNQSYQVQNTAGGIQQGVQRQNVVPGSPITNTNTQVRSQHTVPYVNNQQFGQNLNNVLYQQQAQPLEPTHVNNTTPTPNNNQSQSNLGNLGQELVSQMGNIMDQKGPTAAVMNQGILQPSPVGSPQVMSPGSTPNQTPRPTPTATPQPVLPAPTGTQISQISQGQPSQQASNNVNTHLAITRQGSGASTASLDDILSSSPGNSQEAIVKNDVLTPYRVTAEELERQKEEEMKTSMAHKSKDPYTDDESLGRFVGEVEVFAKHVESMTKHTLSGPTPLDKEWRELSDYQEKESRTLSMAIARCYQMKNRYPDVMPYDATRIVLTGGQDDYVNASHIGDLSPTCPKLIAGQAPLPGTVLDFWEMVYEQGTEVIVMLNSDTETGMQKNHIYWPEEKSRPIHHGAFQLNLQSYKKKNFWHERIITLTHKEARHARSVVHLQFIGWPPAGHPESPTMLLQFVAEVHSFYVQQRSLMKPVIVHCSDGIGRTGSFCVIYTMVQEIDHGKGIVNICDIVKKLRLKRKWMVREKEHLKFCYDAILYYAQDLLMKRGILTNKASFNDKPGTKGSIHTPTEDFIFGSPMPFSAIQSTVARMTLKERQAPDGGEQTTSNSGSVQATKTHIEESSSHSASNSVPGSPQKMVIQQHQVNNQTVVAQNVVISTVSEPHCLPNNGIDLSDNSTSPSVAQQQQGLGQNVGLSQQQQPHQSQNQQVQNVPQSLTDLQNPQTFNLGPSTPPTKKKITKANFENKTTGFSGGGQSGSSGNGDDPLSSLDPLWSIKK